jgi:hypothetical protein
MSIKFYYISILLFAPVIGALDEEEASSIPEATEERKSLDRISLEAAGEIEDAGNRHSHELVVAVQEPENDEEQTTSTTDEMLELIKDEEIPIPQVKQPSTIMVYLRSFGIGLLSRYYALKGWFVKKWWGETQS